MVGTGDVDLVVPVLVGQICSFLTTLDWSLAISRDKLYCKDMVVPGVDVLKRLRLTPKLFD